MKCYNVFNLNNDQTADEETQKKTMKLRRKLLKRPVPSPENVRSWFAHLKNTIKLTFNEVYEDADMEAALGEWTNWRMASW